MDEINNTNKLTSTEHHSISELVESINRNIYNFHKVVHKLQQNYKTNKYAISKLTNDVKNTGEMLFNLNKNIDDNINNNIDNKLHEIRLDIKNIKLDIKEKDIKEIKENDNNNKILNDKFIYYFCANIFTTSVICLAFTRIF
jgi:septal ring factor EnvC (AmiA/AmiB activator)